MVENIFRWFCVIGGVSHARRYHVGNVAHSEPANGNGKNFPDVRVLLRRCGISFLFFRYRLEGVHSDIGHVMKKVRARESWESKLDYLLSAYILEKYDPLRIPRLKGPDGMRTSYCFVETDEYEYEDEPAVKFIVPILEDDMLDYEIQMVGVPDDWKEEVNKLPDGFYKVRYKTFTDSESCDGYTLYEYEAVDSEVEFYPSPVVARALYVWSRVKERLYQATMLFRKVWEIEFQYPTVSFEKTGVWECGGGTGKGNLWLHQALWARLFAKRKWIDLYSFGYGGPDSPRVVIKNRGW